MAPLSSFPSLLLSPWPGTPLALPCPMPKDPSCSQLGLSKSPEGLRTCLQQLCGPPGHGKSSTTIPSVGLRPMIMSKAWWGEKSH